MNVKFPIAGGIVSALLWSALGLSWRVDLAEWLLTLAPLLLVPLAFRLVPPAATVWELRLGGVMSCIYWPAAWLFGAAFLIESPHAAFALTLPWLCFTLVSGSAGALRLFVRHDLPGNGRLTGLSQGLMIVGSSATGLAILGIRPFDFPVGIILLTGVHFHFAAFLLPVMTAHLAGRFGKKWRSRGTVLMIGELIALPMVAVGLIAAPTLELCGVILLASVAIAVAVLQVVAAVRELLRNKTYVASGFLILSSLALVTAMGLAVAYGWGEYRGVPLLSIETMIRTHGLLNALGFCGCGLLGWTLLGQRRVISARDVDTSNVESGSRKAECQRAGVNFQNSMFKCGAIEAVRVRWVDSVHRRRESGPAGLRLRL